MLREFSHHKTRSHDKKFLTFALALFNVTSMDASSPTPISPLSPQTCAYDLEPSLQLSSSPHSHKSIGTNLENESSPYYGNQLGYYETHEYPDSWKNGKIDTRHVCHS
jgi:hypothetical protein